jgi:DUF3006 family protein
MSDAFYTIDRFEGTEWAVIENDGGRTFSIPRTWLPAQAQEGDVVKLEVEERAPQSQLLRLTLDSEARARTQKGVRQQRTELPSGPKGDLSL